MLCGHGFTIDPFWIQFRSIPALIKCTLHYGLTKADQHLHRKSSNHELPVTNHMQDNPPGDNADKRSLQSSGSIYIDCSLTTLWHLSAAKLNRISRIICSNPWLRLQVLNPICPNSSLLTKAECAAAFDNLCDKV